MPRNTNTKINSSIRGNTIGKLQKRAIDGGFLDMQGTDQGEFNEVSFEGVEAVLYNCASELIILAQMNLKNADRISQGVLNDSIEPKQIEINGSVYKLDIVLADYYDYVNKGVKGYIDGGGNSPYQFKQYSRGGKKNSKMVNSIRKWIIREGLKQRTSSIRYPMKNNAREHGRIIRKGNSDTSTSTAIVIAMNIKRHGLQPTLFWDKTMTEIQERFEKEISIALKIDVINNLQTWH